MGKRGKGYGSEDNLLRYHLLRRGELDSALMAATNLDCWLHWVYPGQPQEPKDLDFLQLDNQQAAAWERFWPSPGNRRWDAVARCGTEWILVEAKANEAELCSPTCGAKEPSLSTIIKALKETKSYLGISPAACWHGNYYQYANRIAALYFLNVVAGIPARLVFLYFTGDCFPDGRRCPKDRQEWELVITRCHQHLELPQTHRLSERMHDVFVPALP